MDFPMILLIIGLFSSLLLFSSEIFPEKYADELEKVSISLHQETK